MLRIRFAGMFRNRFGMRFGGRLIFKLGTRSMETNWKETKRLAWHPIWSKLFWEPIQSRVWNQLWEQVQVQAEAHLYGSFDED
jgi:hypothetical protein